MTLAEFNESVQAEIRKELYRRWPPSTPEQVATLEGNIVFMQGASFDEAYAEGVTAEQAAQDEVEAWVDSQ